MPKEKSTTRKGGKERVQRRKKGKLLLIRAQLTRQSLRQY
jgi:hypothetical protein